MKKAKNKYGSVLAFVLIILLVMTLVVFAIASMSTKNLNNVVGEYWEDRARFGAFSGVHRVLTELSNDPTYATNLTDIPLDGDPDVTWSVVIENNAAGAVGFYAAADNRTWVPPGSVYIHAVGKMRSLASSGVASVAAVISPQRPVFNDALFGTESVVLDNSQTVSWYPGVLAEKDAHVATNAIANDVIRLLNNSWVDGDAISGVDPAGAGSPVFNDGSSTIVGSIKKADESKVVTPTFKFPGAAAPPPLPTISGGPLANPLKLPPGVYGPLHLNGTAVELQGGGNYYFQRYIDLRDGAQLTIVDDTANGRPLSLENPGRVYYDTSAVFWNQSRVNWNNGTDQPFEPRLMQIYAADYNPLAPVAKTMHIKEVNKVAFVTAGGDLEVELSDATLHGAIIAREIRAEASVIMYDTRVKGVPLDGTGGFEILSMIAEAKNSQPDLAVPAAPPNQVAVNPPPPAPGAPAPPAAPPGVFTALPPNPVY